MLIFLRQGGCAALLRVSLAVAVLLPGSRALAYSCGHLTFASQSFRIEAPRNVHLSFFIYHGTPTSARLLDSSGGTVAASVRMTPVAAGVLVEINPHDLLRAGGEYTVEVLGPDGPDVIGSFRCSQKIDLDPPRWEGPIGGVAWEAEDSVVSKTPRLRVSLATSPSEDGYWRIAADGKVIRYRENNEYISKHGLVIGGMCPAGDPLPTTVSEITIVFVDYAGNESKPLTALVPDLRLQQ
jgi:hypothetical protein